MNDANSAAEDSATADAAATAAEIEIDAEQAAAIAEVDALLASPLTASASIPVTTLDKLLKTTAAELRFITGDTAKGRCLIATRDFGAGEVVFSEEAVAWCLRASGEGVAVMTAPDDRVLAVLPTWQVLRTLRDSFTLSPAWTGRGKDVRDVLLQMCATEGTVVNGERSHTASGWASVPPLAPGVPECSQSGSDNAVPPLAQLLMAIGQCNAFQAALPLEDSHWKRSILWPALCRLRDPDDRDHLFDDADSLASVSSYFPLAAQLNHACGESANLRYRAVWEEGAPAPVLRVTTAVPIATGTECTISYVGDAHCGGDAADCARRREMLLLTYRFRCACATCVAEEPRAGTDADPLAVHFPLGSGIGGTLEFYKRGGMMPPSG